VRNRGPIIEFALVMILITVLSGVARSVVPDLHQLLRFGLVVLVTVPVVLAVHAVLARYDAGS
jgi:uncharacterized membrane protein